MLSIYFMLYYNVCVSCMYCYICCANDNYLPNRHTTFEFECMHLLWKKRPGMADHLEHVILRQDRTDRNTSLEINLVGYYRVIINLVTILPIEVVFKIY